MLHAEGVTIQEQIDDIYDQTTFVMRHTNGAISERRAMTMTRGELNNRIRSLNRLIKRENAPRKTKTSEGDDDDE